MEDKLISVILPAYNAEKYLGEAIDSILAQTYKNFELIVLNDGSTDKTEEIVLSYKDPRIRYVKNEKNLKLIKTLNKGIDLAKGEYIARMDADDVSLPTRFEEEIKLFETNSELSIVSCLPNNINEQGHFLSHSSYFVCTKNGSCRFVSAIEPPILHPAVMFKASAIKKYKYNDSPEFYHVETLELWHRMLKGGEKCEIIPKYLLNYRDNTSSICHCYGDLQTEHHLIFSRKNYTELLGSNVDDNVIIALSRKKVENLNLMKRTFNLINELKDVFLKNNKNDLTAKEISEIKTWCQQRKLSIIMTSMFGNKMALRLQLIGYLFLHPNLICSVNSSRYIRNRMIRLYNERRFNE